ncbi:hypothetical protein [Reichenbachiella ulvae]|uniref:Uncharacterized protein n=1 Tax=Reichenbachiella ulvae TaxID=2980104 RepID=A0ABT3D0M6_9BACT|nr:hypothetical protein [Reichenbachiella ulvae]MCV9389371.1 hypothetical protein [Reichenbachiella ulvae]
MSTDQKQTEEELQEQFIVELQNNEKIIKHFAEYDEKDVNQLLSEYSRQKAQLKVRGNFTRIHHERVMTEWTNRCWFALCEIQAKKLLDLQCQWRAEQIELPGMKWTWQFLFPSMPLLDYEGVPDVTPEEIEGYIRFLDTPAGMATYMYGFDNRHHYETIKEAHHDGSGEMPEYYNFHYQTTGNTMLLSLPDIRGKEEDRLLKIIREHDKATEKASPAAKVTESKPPKKHLFPYNHEVQLSVAQLLGEKDMAGFIKDLKKWQKERTESETEWCWYYLNSCFPENVPIPAADRYQDAIEQAALQHITKKTQEFLPVIYEEYLMKKQLGSAIGYTSRENERESDFPIIHMLEKAAKLDRGEDPDSLPD